MDIAVRTRTQPAAKMAGEATSMIVQQSPKANRPGIARLEKVLVARSTNAWIPAASVLEHALYTLLDRIGVEYVRQPAFPWRDTDPQRLDAFIPAWFCFVEADGRRWHTRVRDFERDRRRDHEVLAHGYRILRLGWEEIIEDPAYALETIVAIGSQSPRSQSTLEI